MSQMIRCCICILLFIISGNAAKATECEPRYFIEKHINLSLCQYHHLQSLDWLYKARVKAINNYIATKIERGELENKKFEIGMDDPSLSLQYMKINNTPKACYIVVGNIHLDIERLKRIVDACCNPSFKYIEARSSENVDAAEYMDKQLKRYAKGYEGEMPVFECDIWTQQLLSITYKSSDDDLRYVLYGKELPYGVHFSIPSVIKNRYIIPVNLNGSYGIDHFLVYQDLVQIKKFKLPENDFYEEFDINPYVYGNWINFCRYDDCMYSYSYDENKFYHFEPPLKIDL